MPPFYTDNTAPPRRPVRPGVGGSPGKPGAASFSTPQPKVDPYAPLTFDQLQAAARQRAQDTIDAQTRAVNTQQGAYDKQQEQRRQAYVQLSQALSDYLKGMGSQIQAGYQRGAQDIASIGAPLSEGVRADLQKSEDANRAFVESQVQGAAPSSGPNPAALKDVLYGTGALYPSQEMEARGLAGLNWGLAQPTIQLSQGTADLHALDASIDAKDAEYRQQLLDVAAKYPELRDQAMQDLQKWEIDKANYKLDLRKQGLQERAQTDLEKKLGIDTGYKKATLDLRQQTIELQRQGLKLRQQRQTAAVQKATKEGQTIDAPASRVAGHLIDKNGDPILDDNGNNIPIYNKPKASDTQKAYGKAVGEAKTLLGKPVKNPDAAYVPGKYLAVDGATGKDVYRTPGFPATTNNPAKAQSDRTTNFAQAQVYLMNKYGMSKTRARAALIAAGWKPGK